MKDKVNSILFVSILVIISVIGIIQKDKITSWSERRKLAQLPEITENFAEDMNKYLLDQFAFRNFFININSIFNRKILSNIENNNVYVIEDNIVEKNYPLNEKSINNFVKGINKIISNDLSNSEVYYSIIPDKAYFIDENKYLKLNYEEIFKTKSEINAKYINIKDDLYLKDYYKTDIHWKQENLEKIAKNISKNMKCIEQYEEKYTYNQYEKFFGASYSKAGENLKPDSITYLTSKQINNLKAIHLEYGEKNIYDVEKLENIDSYDVYLSGASSYIEIENKNIQNGEELIIFRDSFASSLIPLLTKYYKKITVIDLRYISFDIVKEKVDFEDKNVLFLYSTLIINNSSILKI